MSYAILCACSQRGYAYRTFLRFEHKTGGVSGERELPDPATSLRWRIGPFPSVGKARRFITMARWMRQVQLAQDLHQQRDLAEYTESVNQGLEDITISKTNRAQVKNMLIKRVRRIVSCKYQDAVVAPEDRDAILFERVNYMR